MRETNEDRLWEKGRERSSREARLADAFDQFPDPDSLLGHLVEGLGGPVASCLVAGAACFVAGSTWLFLTGPREGTAVTASLSGRQDGA